MKRKTLVLGVLVIACATPLRSEAGFVDGFVGNSGFESSTILGGWVSFAVYDNTGGADWITDLVTNNGLSLLSGSGATGLERTVFFYQIVRDDTGVTVPASEDFLSLVVPDGQNRPWGTVGAIDGAVFNDGNPVTAASNQTIGTAATAPNPNTYNATELAATPFSANGAANNPATSAFTGAGDASFGFSFDTFAELEHSTVLFVTNGKGPDPVFTPAQSRGDLAFDGPTVDVPVANPEPGSLVLLGLGMMGGGIGLIWKRRRKAATSEV